MDLTNQQIEELVKKVLSDLNGNGAKTPAKSSDDVVKSDIKFSYCTEFIVITEWFIFTSGNIKLSYIDFPPLRIISYIRSTAI